MRIKTTLEVSTTGCRGLDRSHPSSHLLLQVRLFCFDSRRRNDLIISWRFCVTTAPWTRACCAQYGNMEKRQHQEERDVQSSSIDRPAADSPERPSTAALAVSSWCIAAVPSRSTPKQRRPRATGQEDIIKPLHPTCDRWRGCGRQRRVGLVAVEVFCPEERQQRRCRFQDRAFIPRPTGGDHTHALCLQTCRHV